MKNDYVQPGDNLIEKHKMKKPNTLDPGLKVSEKASSRIQKGVGCLS
jgi:hypothetical protein